MTLTKTNKSISKYNDQAKLNAITDIALQNILQIYEYFDVSPHQGKKVYFSNCFIHGGDNRTALNLYYDADYRVHYKCRTHSCQSHFGTSLLSMIRGGLSHIKYNWKLPGDKTVSFEETVDFVVDLLKIDYKNIKVNRQEFSNNYEFCKLTNKLIKDKSRNTLNIDKAFYRSKVEIPSQYFLNRGYSIEILDDYDVGTCKTYGKPFYNRAVVPVYDETGEFIVGFTGRSVFEQCKECKSYHDPLKKCFHFPKWRHSEGFEKEKYLYNYHKAKKFIQETGVIILVESPGNVWRLEESGIHNSVGLFGTVLNESQKELIDQSGALSIILLMDNDENGAGQSAALKIKDQCEKAYRVFIVNIKKNDIGEMNSNEITDDILPWIEKAKQIYL